MAPPTVIAIFLSSSLQENGFTISEGSIAVFSSGLILMLFGYKPILHFFTSYIPVCIQVGCSIGIGLLTCFAGAADINLVIKGDYTLLQLGPFTPEMAVAFSGIIIIFTLSKYKVKSGFCIILFLNSILLWTINRSWPKSICAIPLVNTLDTFSIETSKYSSFVILVVEIVFLYFLYLDGINKTLSQIGALQREDGQYA